MTDAPMPPENTSATTNLTPAPAPITPETPEAAANSTNASGFKFELSRFTKSVINILTLIVAVGTPLLSYTTNLLPENVALAISGVVAVAGSILHVLVPNTTTNPEVAATSSAVLKTAA